MRLEIAGGKGVLLVLLVGCGSASFGTKPTPSPGAKPTVKRELPWLMVPGGRMKTTLFYGPWQCRNQFMRQCQLQCTQAGHPLMGCMWLADIQLDWEGSLVLLPISVEAGSRYGIYPCCCDYPVVTKAQNEVARKQWERFRASFREDWSKQFGQWPISQGEHWPGHHVLDLKHGGNPTDPSGIIPAEPLVHDDFGKKYPACYRGEEPWRTAGSDLPYTDD